MGTHKWQYLIDKYLANTISREELTELLNMAGEQEDYAKLTAVLKSYWETLKDEGQHMQPDWDAKFAAMMKEAGTERSVVTMTKTNRTNWFYRISAAIIIGAVAIGGYLMLSQPGKKQPATISAQIIKKDIPAPASNNAVLTLANGKTILLDSASNGSLAVQGNIDVVKSADGQLVYNGKANGEMQYNILTVPKGSKVAGITLADGTKLWLNAGSSLKYPVAFSGNERKVDITGEAYFEVAHNAAIPFKVQKDSMLVTVLGTHFNVNAYEDEANIKVTLLEGTVKINKGKAVGLLKPGQQASIGKDIKTFKEVDTDEAVAWINGKFQFGEAADITSVMKQISRWYDVDIEYQGTVAGHIGGTISRTENVSQVLKMLEMTGVVTFKMNDKKIVVMNK
ncbi:MAG: FecR domain-containing protein [Chitinophagaceae bacterium]